MQSKKDLNRGYVGLLMLLIGVAVVAFLMTKGMTSFLGGSASTNTNNTNTGEHGINSNLNPIDAAKEAKNLIEQNNTKAIEQLK